MYFLKTTDSNLSFKISTGSLPREKQFRMDWGSEAFKGILQNKIELINYMTGLTMWKIV